MKYGDVFSFVVFLFIFLDYGAGCMPNEFLYEPRAVDISEYKFIVAIKLYETFQCAGIILSSKYILTSAQCVCFLNDDMTTKLRVHTGITFTTDRGIVIPVKKKNCHPSSEGKLYSSGNFTNVAVIELETKIKYDSKRYFARLDYDTPAGSQCSLVGWNTMDEDFESAKQLKALTVGKPSTKTCLALMMYTEKRNVGIDCAFKERHKPVSYQIRTLTPKYTWISLGAPLVCNKKVYGIFDNEKIVRLSEIPALITFTSIEYIRRFIQDTLYPRAGR